MTPKIPKFNQYDRQTRDNILSFFFLSLSLSLSLIPLKSIYPPLSPSFSSSIHQSSSFPSMLFHSFPSFIVLPHFSFIYFIKFLLFFYLSEIITSIPAFQKNVSPFQPLIPPPFHLPFHPASHPPTYPPILPPSHVSDESVSKVIEASLYTFQ